MAVCARVCCGRQKRRRRGFGPRVRRRDKRDIVTIVLWCSTTSVTLGNANDIVQHSSTVKRLPKKRCWLYRRWRSSSAAVDPPLPATAPSRKPLMQRGCTSRSRATTRTMIVKSYKVKLQFTSSRARDTTLDVCFLQDLLRPTCATTQPKVSAIV